MTSSPATTSAPRTASVDVRGPFSLEEVAMMGFGHRDERAFDGVMRLAFATDADLEHAVGVEVRQTSAQQLQLAVHDGPGTPAELDAVALQVARIVSADHDGEAFDQICRADPGLAPVHALAPGFRPALFHSAYDACVWSVLSARRQRHQAIALRTRFSQAHGVGFDLAGQRLHALPAPSALLALQEFEGLPSVALPRLHALAEAGAAGDLDVARLQTLAQEESPEAAMADLQLLPGVGPFYSALVVIRALGLTDVLSTQEEHSRRAIQQRYALDHLPDEAELIELTQPWRPFRTWATVMLRALADRSPR